MPCMATRGRTRAARRQREVGQWAGPLTGSWGRNRPLPGVWYLPWGMKVVGPMKEAEGAGSRLAGLHTNGGIQLFPISRS